MSIIQLAEKLYTVDDYYKMAEVGILKPSDKVELINGKIIKMSPVTSKHSSHVKRIARLLYKLFSEEVAVLSVQDPIKINDFSEPEPDIAILKPKDDFYSERHPVPNDVLLLIEVAVSTLNIDRKVKLPLYAEAGIQEYWIVNVKNRTIEIYKNPKGKKYLDKKIVENEDAITISSLNETVKVSQLLI